MSQSSPDMNTQPQRPGIDFPGVGCGLVIQRDDGKILMLRRMKRPRPGLGALLAARWIRWNHLWKRPAVKPRKKPA